MKRRGKFLSALLKKVIFLTCVFFINTGFENNYKMINSIPFQGDVFFTTDKLGNAYVIVENQLLQFDAEGNPVANFSESNLGTLYYVDPSNPMKILLFYRDFAKIKILDSKLSTQSDIELRSLNINQPLAACTSRDDGYWVYDREDEQLKKIDLNLQVVQRSGSLTQQLGYQVQPGIMIEDDGFVYMNNPSSGIIVFDRFGNYYKTIPYKNLTGFQLIEKEILFINHNKFFRYDSKIVSEKEILLPTSETVKSARIEQNQLYLLTSTSLNFYSF